MRLAELGVPTSKFPDFELGDGTCGAELFKDHEGAADDKRNVYATF
jgi:hypothetical protein